MHVIEMRKILKAKFKDFNKSIREQNLTNYAFFGAASLHFAQRLIERVDAEDREKIIDLVVTYVSRNNQKLTQYSIGEEVTISNGKYVMKLVCIPGVRCQFDLHGGLTTQVLAKTVYKPGEIY